MSTWEAVRIVVLADAVMSLDNVIALVGASGGSLPLLAVGIAITIPLVIWGASLLTSLLDRLPMLVYAGAGLLVYIAVGVFFADEAVRGYVEHYVDYEPPVGLAVAVVFVTVAWLWGRYRKRAGKIKGA